MQNFCRLIVLGICWQASSLCWAGERVDFERDIRRLPTPALIVVGDEDERCIEPGLFLKDAIAASGLMVFPRTGHAVNLEEPDLFNQVVDDFISRVDGGSWLPRDPRTRPPRPPAA